MYDLLLKGGTVVDPSTGLDGVRDVAVRGRDDRAHRAGHPAGGGGARPSRWRARSSRRA